ncbi:LysR family transcriptional regulator [Caproiciproducens sp. NJN-50]|uniref:LysR family transcriptional regulator n=1 Tax=Caproiciproducens sp. NJN-50 TaxID=2507162 RepID=UPI000FFE128F|nr:LysR family transcriptional regulator [Caproiciproducens sp. NJN-50]QAT48904.1 LysR family transcriptional regulator [Caproiciproducens sp. NJN-50]
MDLKQVEYIVQIANECNITKAAEKLFLTQSALNQQLLKLERELQTPLFYRSRTNWRLTPAGEVYIKNAKELLRIKRETYRIISDIAETKKGNLSVGFTPGRGIPMFTRVYPKFHGLYPDIVVTPVEASVKKQQIMIENGDLDLGFLTLSDNQKKSTNRYIDICEEDICLAVPENDPLADLVNFPEEISNITPFRDRPFVLMYKESSFRPLIDGIFQKAGFSPKVLFETSQIPAIVTIIESGICCGIIPYLYLKGKEKKIRYCYLPGRPTWKICASYGSQSYLGRPAKEFIRLAADYWVASETVQLQSSGIVKRDAGKIGTKFDF